MAASMDLEPLTPERRRRQTREHLLEAAARVLAERGYHGASLDEVAAAAGFTKGAVYSNFKNKEDLFIALLEWLHDREMAELRKTLAKSEIPPESRLTDFVALMRDQLVVSQTPGAWTALNLEFSLYAIRNEAVRVRLAEIERTLIESVAEIIQHERERRGIHLDETSTEVARIIQALIRGLSIMRAIDPEALDESFYKSTVNFIARATAPASEQATPLL
jgi:AcrR family transcriptional regulator